MLQRLVAAGPQWIDSLLAGLGGGRPPAKSGKRVDLHSPANPLQLLMAQWVVVPLGALWRGGYLALNPLKCDA